MKRLHVDIVAYDLDGTLSHSLPDIAGAMNISLADEGFPVVEEAMIRSFVGDGVQKLAERTLSFSLGGDADYCLEPGMAGRFIEKYRNQYAEHCTDRSSLYDGVREILDYYNGKVQVLITNKPLIMTQKMLDYFNIGRYFQYVVCGDTLPVRKPDRAVIEYIFARMNGTSDMVLVGDSTVDIQTAKNAGILSVAVDYGYTDKELLVSATPDYLISSIAELKDIILP